MANCVAQAPPVGVFGKCILILAASDRRKVEDVELRDEVLQVVTFVLACIIGEKNLHALVESMMFQIRVDCACVDPLVPCADGSDAKMPDRELVGLAIDDELL